MLNSGRENFQGDPYIPNFRRRIRDFEVYFDWKSCLKELDYAATNPTAVAGVLGMGKASLRVLILRSTDSPG